MASSKSKGNEDMTKAAGKMWEFLDKLATENPDEYKKFIDQQLEEGRNIMTPPEPAYCIQCQVRAWVNMKEFYCDVCIFPATALFFVVFFLLSIKLIRKELEEGGLSTQYQGY